MGDVITISVRGVGQSMTPAGHLTPGDGDGKRNVKIGALIDTYFNQSITINMQ